MNWVPGFNHDPCDLQEAGIWNYTVNKFAAES